MATKKTDYQALNQELDALLLRLQAEDLDVDEAVTLYERGIAITKELETYLKQAENTVAKIKADLSS